MLTWCLQLTCLSDRAYKKNDKAVTSKLNNKVVNKILAQREATEDAEYKNADKCPESEANTGTQYRINVCQLCPN